MTAHEQPEEQFLTVEAAAVLAGISHWTVRSWLSKGILIRYKAASRTVVDRFQLLDLVRPRVMPPPPTSTRTPDRVPRQITKRRTV